MKLAALYSNGQGGPRDEKKAASLYALAAKGGNKKALQHLYKLDPGQASRFEAKKKSNAQQREQERLAYAERQRQASIARQQQVQRNSKEREIQEFREAEEQAQREQENSQLMLGMMQQFQQQNQFNQGMTQQYQQNLLRQQQEAARRAAAARQPSTSGYSQRYLNGLNDRCLKVKIVPYPGNRTSNVHVENVCQETIKVINYCGSQGLTRIKGHGEDERTVLGNYKTYVTCAWR